MEECCRECEINLKIGFYRNRIEGIMCILKLNLFLVIFSALQLNAGELDVIWNRTSGSSGQVPITAQIQNTVSLKIEDNPTAGGNLASQSGIHFGNVNSSGTTDTPGVTGSQKGDAGHYEAQFLFSIERSGNGHMTLHCRRTGGGNFNAKDGIEIDDKHGVLKALPALSTNGVSVLENKLPGTYDKRIAINVYPSDKGTLKAVLQFTLCAL